MFPVVRFSVKTKPGQASLAPVVLFFRGDIAIEKRIGELRRYRRVALDAGDGEATLQAGCPLVLVTSAERLLASASEALRAPHVRIIALSDHRFRDPRLDAAVYAYLPAKSGPEWIERMVANALEHIHLVGTRRELGERLAAAGHELQELNRIGAALSAEHNTDTLLEMILRKAREITRSDAGSLYLVEIIPSRLPDHVKVERRKTPRKRLRFKLAQNDSVDVRFVESVMDIDDKSIAGYVARTGQIVNLPDAYHISDEVPFAFNRKFDEDSGYRTKAMLAVPLRNPKDEVVGVLQLINPKLNPGARLDSLTAVAEQVTPFSTHQQDVVASLASQAAVALENSRLYESIQRLFEGFVKAAVTAIEARDPATSGHSFRVANLTLALAETADRTRSGPYANLHFSREQMRELRYAALLHDFGKVGVREDVLLKARKLYPGQLEVVRQRFRFAKRSAQAESLRAKLDYILAKGRANLLKRQAKMDRALAEELAQLDCQLAALVQANEPGLLGAEQAAELWEVARRRYVDLDGSRQPLLHEEELSLLSIPKGSLDAAERKQIESHVVHTFNFLQQIPWTPELRGIPEIARGHHEKLNGTGYPYRLHAPEIPVQTRMMTIADVFDALGAADRPYKRAVAPERSLEMLRAMVEDGELDGDLFQLFLDAKVYERWKIEPDPY